MNQFIPTNITVNRETNLLIISWKDGHQSSLPFSLLRNACPCAECAGGHENMRSEPDPDVFLIPLQDSRGTRIVDLQLIGNYAISITWGDGHSHGIYQWRYLRLLDQNESEE